ncbi:hypothetical protein AAFF_G00033480, partial [Aldrovandia affinis]
RERERESTAGRVLLQWRGVKGTAVSEADARAIGGRYYSAETITLTASSLDGPAHQGGHKRGEFTGWRLPTGTPMPFPEGMPCGARPIEVKYLVGCWLHPFSLFGQTGNQGTHLQRMPAKGHEDKSAPAMSFGEVPSGKSILERKSEKVILD